MGKYGSKDVGFFLVGGYSILGVMTELSDDKEALFEETHTLGDSWVEQDYVGLRRMKLEQKGFYDDSAGSVNTALATNEGSDRVLCYGVEGNTKGKKFVGFFGALLAKWSRKGTRGEFHKADASYEGSGQVDEGVILHEHTAETTATGNTEANSHDNAAATADGGAAYLQVSALTLGGYTNLAVVVEDSADNVTFADHADGAFTVVTASPNGQRKALTGSIRRYTAVRWAFTGAGSGQTATFMAGISRA